MNFISESTKAHTPAVAGYVCQECCSNCLWGQLLRCVLPEFGTNRLFSGTIYPFEWLVVEIWGSSSRRGALLFKSPRAALRSIQTRPLSKATEAGCWT